jgi:hypothetical protein
MPKPTTRENSIDIKLILILIPDILTLFLILYN